MDWQLLAAVLAIASFGIAALTGYVADPLGRRLGLLDYPDLTGGRKRHARVTPLVGGIGLVPAVVGSTLLTARVLAIGPYAQTQFVWMAACVAAMFLIGLADDRFALGATIRLVLAVAALTLGILHAPDCAIGFVRFAGQSSTILAPGWGDAFTLLCLVGLLNAVNMADGKNGIVIGLGLIWSVVLWFRLPPTALPIAASAFAALAVLLWFNLRGRLFLGDGGSYAISALFGLLAIYAYNHGFAQLRADDIAVMFAVPVFDTIRLMGGRRSKATAITFTIICTGISAGRADWCCTSRSSPVRTWGQCCCPVPARPGSASRCSPMRWSSSRPAGRSASPPRGLAAPSAASTYARSMGRRQVVRHRFLVPASAGSNPAAPASYGRRMLA